MIFSSKIINKKGIGNLSSTLIINSATVASLFQFKGGDANITNWIAYTADATTLTLQVGVAPSIKKGSPFSNQIATIPNYDNSVLFNTGDGGYYMAGNNAIADITTDLILRQLETMVPLSTTRKEDIDELRTQAATRAIPASTTEEAVEEIIPNERTSQIELS